MKNVINNRTRRAIKALADAYAELPANTAVPPSVCDATINLLGTLGDTSDDGEDGEDTVMTAGEGGGE